MIGSSHCPMHSSACVPKASYARIRTGTFPAASGLTCTNTAAVSPAAYSAVSALSRTSARYSPSSSSSSPSIQLSTFAPGAVISSRTRGRCPFSEYHCRFAVESAQSSSPRTTIWKHARPPACVNSSSARRCSGTSPYPSGPRTSLKPSLAKRISVFIPSPSRFFRIFLYSAPSGEMPCAALYRFQVVSNQSRVRGSGRTGSNRLQSPPSAPRTVVSTNPARASLSGA